VLRAPASAKGAKQPGGPVHRRPAALDCVAPPAETGATAFWHRPRPRGSALRRPPAPLPCPDPISSFPAPTC